MMRYRIGLLLIAALAFGSAGQCQTGLAHVRIVNKAKLPPERLADALAAKALLTNFDPKLLRSAAEVSPRDPRYWYFSAITRDSYVLETRGYAASEKAKPAYRALLERALTVDPSFLPALYAYVVSQPTHKQRMQGLEKVAALDPDNAKPYYLMALELYQETTKGRTIIRSSGFQPYPLSHQEWQSVLDLIRQGNQQPSFHANAVRLPSATDLRIRVSGKAVPPADSEIAILVAVDACRNTDFADAPCDFSTAAYSRQLARQADWEARQAYKQGRLAEALDMLEVIRAFGVKYAVSEPRGLVQLSVGCAIRLIADYEQAAILKAAGDGSAARALKTENRACENVIKQMSTSLLVLMPRPTESFADIAKARRAEATLVSKTLARLGWVPSRTKPK
jgi:hypothetical protein